VVEGQPEIRFGIGIIAGEGRPETAVVVKDHVASLRDIVARHSTPGAAAPLMRDFLPDWERWHGWLRGLDLDPARGDYWRPMTAVKFLPPVPEPNNIFHTYHNYDRPSSVTGRRDPPKSERVLPDIFFGSRSALSGHGDTVYREHGGMQFDFELELTAVIGRTAYRVSADKADDYVAGYTIANDLTMHFGWWKAVRAKTPINDNIRMKNFPGYTPLGPVIVPRDIVGDPHALWVGARQDNVLRLDATTRNMIWRIGELIEYLSWIMPLQPGDLILTGSEAELPLEHGERRGIKVGQTIVCEVEKLGRLATLVLEQDVRQPNEVAPVGGPDH
jgi:2-keto-4-pentenoate hydratase/2-oxohepta-3-ene-1,7-dioic acid hydratase in catechol pathway